MLLLLLACSDGDVNGKNPFIQADPLDSGLDTSTDSEGPPEECNGVDDDGDGGIDEDFPDADGNGRVDCLDGDCPLLTLPAAGPVEPIVECPALEVTDPWAMRVKWSADAPSSHADRRRSLSTPLVTQFTDDNEDGLINGEDDPEIVLVVTGDTLVGTLVVLDGITGTTEWEIDNLGAAYGFATGDLDVDGVPDLVYVDDMGNIAAANADGSEKWSSSRWAGMTGQPLLTIVDWDSDGYPEVWVDGAFLDGETGLVVEETGIAQDYSLPAFADVDFDGELEIATFQGLFHHDGSPIFLGGTAVRGWPMFVQADDDPEPEVVIAENELSIYDIDGTVLGRTPELGVGMPAPPAVGDFDGDGLTEIAYVDGSVLHMVEMDDTIVWEAAVNDASSYAGVSGVDLDGDGALEVLYADEDSFDVYEGRTGTLVLTDTTHLSLTLADYPVAVDLDHDGHTEILVVSAGDTGLGALTVFEHDGGGWAGAGRAWPIHDYAYTNIGEDGSVPSSPWQDPGLVRAVPSAAGLGVDLGVTFTDTCIADCDYGPVEVALQVWNAGGIEAPAGGTLTLYREADSILEYPLPAIPAHSSLDALQFALDVGDVSLDGWAAVVTPAGGTIECDDADNTARGGEGVCG